MLFDMCNTVLLRGSWLVAFWLCNIIWLCDIVESFDFELISLFKWVLKKYAIKIFNVVIESVSQPIKDKKIKTFG